MSLVVKVNSPHARMWLQEARTLWSLRKFDKAADRAAKVVKVEGVGVFAPQDKPLLEAAMKRIAELKKRQAKQK